MLFLILCDRIFQMPLTTIPLTRSTAVYSWSPWTSPPMRRDIPFTKTLPERPCTEGEQIKQRQQVVRQNPPGKPTSSGESSFVFHRCIIRNSVMWNLAKCLQFFWNLIQLRRSMQIWHLDPGPGLAWFSYTDWIHRIFLLGSSFLCLPVTLAHPVAVP